MSSTTDTPVDAKLEPAAAPATPYRGWCHLVLCGAQFLDVFLGLTILLPIIIEELEPSPNDVQWILSAYNLTFGGLLLLFGRLTDLFGKKKGFAPNANHLIVGRALQGIGAAANIPSAVGAITDLFSDPKERNIALSQFGAASPLGFICGLFVAGTVGHAIDKPISGNFMALAKKIDYFGALLATGSLVMFTYAISAGSVTGWATVDILAPLILSIVGVAGFVFWEMKTDNPLVPASFFNKKTSLILVMTFFVFFGFNGFAVFANLSLQNVYLMSTVMTAVHLIPMMVVGFLTASATGHLATRYPNPLPFLIFGHISMILACVLFAVANPDTIYWALPFPALCLIVLGFDVVFNFFNILLMSSVAEEHRSFAGGMLNTVCQLGTGVGVAIDFTVSDIISGGSADVWDISRGYSGVFYISIGLISVSLVLGVGFYKLWTPRQLDIVEDEVVMEGGNDFKIVN
ncbi:hypothetical protein HDU98_001334 [Podochytrium sp. JEL0797]|nr:hypothetical protein HDU98_001334 [Podochytrium sp. JEL0797]